MKTSTDERVVAKSKAQEPSKDHQSQISVIAVRQSLMAALYPQGPQSGTCGRLRLASP